MTSLIPDTGRQRSGAGRPARITREDVADAALTIGLDKVTLAAIGQRLGVDHSSLYRHVKGREDILAAAADRAIATLDWERSTRDWRTYVEAAAEAVWDLYARYPGLAGVIRAMQTTPPAGIRAFSAACRRLEAFGFTPEAAVLVMDSVMDMTSDSSLGWQHLQIQAETGGTIADSLRRSWQAQIELDPATASHVALMSAIITGDPKDWWRKKLSLLLDGAATMLNCGSFPCKPE